jgi:outer membrane protein insertion porin family
MQLFYRLPVMPLSVLTGVAGTMSAVLMSALSAQAAPELSKTTVGNLDPQPLEAGLMRSAQLAQSGLVPESLEQLETETTRGQGQSGSAAQPLAPEPEIIVAPVPDSSTRAEDLLIEETLDVEPTFSPADAPDDSETPDVAPAQNQSSLVSLDAEAIAQIPAIYDFEQGNALRFQFSSDLPDPTALQSSLRRRVVRTTIQSTGLSAVASLRQTLSDDSYIHLAVIGGTTALGADLGVVFGNFGANVFSQRSHIGAFKGGDRDVDLPTGDTPWIHRLGGGVEYTFSIGNEIESALGVTYQRVSVRDDFFSDEIFPRDEDGNRFTVENSGIDDLVSIDFVAAVDRRNDGAYSTEGSLLRFGVSQGFLIDTGDAFTRLAGFYTHYLPLNLFGFDEGPRTLVLNVQAGTVLGDVPPYIGFNLGGNNSVRGFSGGGISTGSSFVQATAEYRFPVAQLNLFDRDIDLRGVLFIDYATDLGTADEVIGEPAVARDKPGDGFGFGAGLQARTPLGFARLEFGFTDTGESRLIATFGDRF